MPALTARRCWLLAHRWVGLVLGLLLALSGFTGAALTLARPLDEYAHPQLYRVPSAAQQASLDGLRARLEAEFGPGAGFVFRPPRQPDESLRVLVRGPWDGALFIDPGSGVELGRRGEREGWLHVLFELHSALLIEASGRAVLAIAAAAYLLMLLSGLVLWWPARWRHAFSVKTRSGLTRALFDLHRVGGATLGVAVFVSVASGLYMAWRPVSAWVSAAAGQVTVRPPTVERPSGAPVASLDAMVERARRVFPEGEVGYVQWPGQRSSPVRVRLRLPDDPHPNGLSSVWLHPSSGEVLAVHRWAQLDAGARGYSWIYPLHIGDLGGPLHLGFNLVSGLALAGFGLSGLWLWWRRR
ncbi:PepSY domain-containing protein [Schlegelella sp. S2-27]|uniref:PepSY domain-containing protein n=1 Tax=Caldimonas mangrovi TaxID=2944811 RepID=A0ABT0YKY7_9BURK|nr:PepSY domain-containing protein [Caldimonas mangrovi]